MKREWERGTEIGREAVKREGWRERERARERKRELAGAREVSPHANADSIQKLLLCT